MKRVSTVFYIISVFFLVSSIYIISNDCTTVYIDEFIAALCAVCSVVIGATAQAYRDRGE